MLYWHFRNWQCLLAALFKSRLTDPTKVVTKHFIANPFDSDWFQVLRAGQFFLYSDAARWDLAVRSGFLKASLKNKLVVILGGQKIIHWRPVKIFRRFNIAIQFAGWDDKWIYAAHTYRQGGDVKCVSFTKIGLRQYGKLYNPQKAFDLMGYPQPHLPPPHILKFFENDVADLQATAAMQPSTVD